MTAFTVGDRVRLIQILEGEIVDSSELEFTIATEKYGQWSFELPLEEGIHTVEVLKRQPKAGEVWKSTIGPARRFYYYNTYDQLVYVTQHGAYGDDPVNDYWEFVA